MILVTGAAGYLGTILVTRLLQDGHKVRAVDVGWFPHGLNYLLEFLVSSEAPYPLEIIQKDIRDMTLHDFAGITCVMHLAGLSNDPMANMFPDENYAINVDATRALAVLAKSAGVRQFMFASSASVYDGCDPSKPAEWNDAPESSPYHYSNSKLVAERCLETLADRSFQVVIMRQGTLWGYSPRMRYDLVVNTMVRDAVALRHITVISPKDDSPHYRPMCHVGDCADGYIIILRSYDPDRLISLFRRNIVTENISIPELGGIVVSRICPGGWLEIRTVDKVRSYQAQIHSAGKNTVLVNYGAAFQSGGWSNLVVCVKEHAAAKAVYDLQTRNIDWLTANPQFMKQEKTSE